MGHEYQINIETDDYQPVLLQLAKEFENDEGVGLSIGKTGFSITNFDFPDYDKLTVFIDDKLNKPLNFTNQKQFYIYCLFDGLDHNQPEEKQLLGRIIKRLNECKYAFNIEEL